MDRIKAADATTMYPSLDSLNQLASVAWRVDTKILDIVIEIFRKGGSEKLGISRPPSALPPLQLNETTDKAKSNNKWNYEMLKAKISHQKTQAEMFSLWCDLLYRLSLANHVSKNKFIQKSLK